MADLRFSELSEPRHAFPARSTVSRLAADSELRASRISSRTIRISVADLQPYFRTAARKRLGVGGQAEWSRAMTTDQLTAILAERVMGWRVGPDRFLTGNRRWMPRWRYRPLDHLPDAIRLLEAAGPGRYTITDTNGLVSVRVQIAGITGETRTRETVARTGRPEILQAALERRPCPPSGSRDAVSGAGDASRVCRLPAHSSLAS